MFKSDCECLSDDHQQTISVEREEGDESVTAYIFTRGQVKADSFLERVTVALKVLFNKAVYTEVEYRFTEDALKDYIDTLDAAFVELTNTVEDEEH